MLSTVPDGTPESINLTVVPRRRGKFVNYSQTSPCFLSLSLFSSGPAGHRFIACTAERWRRPLLQVGRVGDVQGRSSRPVQHLKSRLYLPGPAHPISWRPYRQRPSASQISSTVPAPARNTRSIGIHTRRPSGCRTGCSPAYPTVCIPPPPPDLNRKDIPYKRFQVLAPDPHHFDSDHDGIGCES